MLDPADIAILQFAKKYYRYAGERQTAIRDTFDLSVNQFTARLQRIIDTDEAALLDPILVRRLRRMRDRRFEQLRARRAS